MKVVERKHNLIFWLLLILFPLLSMGQSKNSPDSAFENRLNKKIYNFSFSDKLLTFDNTLFKGQFSSTVQKSIYKFDDLALFCKFEEKVAQKSKLAMRVRLGSLDYVDYLESKPYKINKY
jgi:hypothetical protein